MPRGIAKVSANDVIASALRKRLKRPAEVKKVVDVMMAGLGSPDKNVALKYAGEILDRAYGPAGKSQAQAQQQQPILFEVSFIERKEPCATVSKTLTDTTRS
jgi:hypothetical protein